MRRSKLWLALSISWLLPFAAAGEPTDPVTFTPVPDVAEIFSPGVRLVVDLEPAYTEEEFFVEGASTVYTYNDPPVPTEIIPLEEDVPYATRVIVRRPVDPAHFNGSVVIEWWNSTAGFDTAPVWDPSAEFFAREGWIYVGVTNSASSIGHLVVGCSLAVGLLPSTCPGRYDTPDVTLSIPQNGQAFEMVSQIAHALKSGGPDSPIPPEYGRVERLFHAGQSQQGGSMVTYTTAFHFEANDGYFIQAAGTARPINFRDACGVAGSLPYPDCTPRLVGADRLVRTDLPVPVYRAQTETDMGCGPPFCDDSTPQLRPRGVIGGDTRQEDTPNFRYYEMAGTAHVTVHKDVQVIPPIPPIFPNGLFLEDTCELPLNTLADGPVFGSYLYNAMWRNLEQDVDSRRPAPHGDLIEVAAGRIQRDEFGNALGGLRLPSLDVPIASYGPNNRVSPSVPAVLQPLLGLFCVLSGTRADFDQATLDALYPVRESYVGEVTLRAFKLLHQRFLLWEDMEIIVARAEMSGIGMPHCGLGAELVLVLPPILVLRQRLRRRKKSF